MAGEVMIGLASQWPCVIDEIGPHLRAHCRHGSRLTASFTCHIPFTGYFVITSSELTLPRDTVAHRTGEVVINSPAPPQLAI